MFKWVTSDRKTPPLSHLVGLALLLGLAFQPQLTPLWLGVLTTVALAVGNASRLGPHLRSGEDPA